MRKMFEGGSGGWVHSWNSLEGRTESTLSKEGEGKSTNGKILVLWQPYTGKQRVLFLSSCAQSVESNPPHPRHHIWKRVRRQPTWNQRFFRKSGTFENVSSIVQHLWTWLFESTCETSWYSSRTHYLGLSTYRWAIVRFLICAHRFWAEKNILILCISYRLWGEILFRWFYRTSDGG